MSADTNNYDLQSVEYQWLLPGREYQWLLSGHEYQWLLPGREISSRSPMFSKRAITNLSEISSGASVSNSVAAGVSLVDIRFSSGASVSNSVAAVVSLVDISCCFLQHEITSDFHVTISII